MYKNRKLPFSWENIKRPLFFPDNDGFSKNLEQDIEATMNVKSAREAQEFGLISSALGKRAAQICLKTVRYYISEDVSSMYSLLSYARTFSFENIDMDYILRMEIGDVFPLQTDEDFIPVIAKYMTEPDEKELFRTLVGQNIFWNNQHPIDAYLDAFGFTNVKLEKEGNNLVLREKANNHE